MSHDTSFRIDPLTVPEEETSEETFRRLAPLARAELEAAARRAEEAGLPLLATATDGSLGTRRVWPSSDLDVMLVPAVTPQHTIEWDVRAGLVVHRHLNSWEALSALSAGYPQSFIDTAAGRRAPGPKPFLLQPSAAAAQIARAAARGEAHSIFPWPFALLLWVDRLLPLSLRDRLLLALTPHGD